MFAGRVTIASRISDLGEIIRHGETGFLFESGDHRGLAELLKCVIRMSPAERLAMGAKARAHAVERYSSNTMVDAFEELCFASAAESRR